MARSRESILVRSVEGREYGSYKTTHHSASYIFKSLEDIESAAAGVNKVDMYKRYSGEDDRKIERTIAYLESGETAQMFASGMAAIHTCLYSLINQGRIIASVPLYSTTYESLCTWRQKFKVDVQFFDARTFSSDLARLSSDYLRYTDFIYIETPANPTMELIDIASVCEVANSVSPRPLVVVDNTIATPYNQKPLLLGADCVLHSVTKGLSGHGDLMAGALVTSEKTMKRMHYPHVGAVLSPYTADKLETELQTFPLRMHAHNENALKVAYYLAENPTVARFVNEVRYPGLPYDPSHTIAQKQMTGGFGGMIAFRFIDCEKMRQFIDFLAQDSDGVVDLCVSLGTTRSKIVPPWSVVHCHVSEMEKRAQDITPELVRLWVGLENLEDIIGSLKRAFKSISE